MKRVTFYYVRHGRTEFNRDGIIQGGRVDSPLVPESLSLIEDTARVLAGIDFTSCYSSPLGRARETARMVVGERNIAIQPLDELREFDFGTLDGRPASEVGRRFAACFVRQDFSRYGGEKGSEVRRRVRRAFERMLGASRDGEEVLVVAHGALLRYVLLEFYPAGPLRRKLMSETLRTPNAGIAVVEGAEVGSAEAGAAGGETVRGSAEPKAGAGARATFELKLLPCSASDFRRSPYYRP